MTRWRKAQQSLSIRAQLADWHFSTKVRRMHLDVEMIEAVTEKGAISHPKWKQGDPDFYTRDNIAKRLSLRRDALVSDTLQKWWKVMQNTFAVSEKVPCVCLTEDQFVVVLRKIAKTLLAADEYDKDDVEQAAREDWAVDSCGQEQMTREMFMDALFELCDLWTDGISAQEYHDFLVALLKQVAGGSPPSLLDDSLIGYGGFKPREDDPYGEAARLAEEARERAEREAAQRLAREAAEAAEEAADRRLTRKLRFLLRKQPSPRE